MLSPTRITGRWFLALLAGVAMPAQRPEIQAATAVVIHVADAACEGRRELLDAARAAILERRAAPELGKQLAQLALVSTRELVLAITAAGGNVHHTLVSPMAIHATLPDAAITELAERADVARIDPVRTFRAHTGDATAAANHNAQFVHAIQGLRGEGQVLALVDTGVELTFLGGGLPHPAFTTAAGASRVVRSWSVQGPTLADRSDQNGHGTGVGSVAVGRAWSTSPQVADGFAPAAAIASYRVTHGTGDIATDVDLALAYGQILLDVIGGMNIRVANCSFGGNPDPRAVDQQALDELAFFGDVLVVTSAGNIVVPQNLDYRATVQSQAATNGLAVGACSKTSHIIAPFSAYGPLHGDGARTFPDLTAVGQAVRVAVRTNTGIAVVDGTSYSAPMAAGTALLVRQARPDLDATACKAILLGACTDLQAANPALSRNHTGLGLLRTDLAVQNAFAAVTLAGSSDPGAPRLCRGSVSAGGTSNWSLSLPASAAIRATLVWLRDEMTASSSPDLDLEVRDAAGHLLARGNALRNLYEQVVFPAATAGVVTFAVHGRSVPGDDVPFALVVHDAGTAPASPAITVLAGGCAGTGIDAGLQLALPASTGFGGARTNKPLADAPLVLQAAYDKNQIPSPRQVRALGFRRALAEGATPALAVRLRLTLGYTQLPPNGLQAQLAGNFGSMPPPVIGFDGWAQLGPTLPEPLVGQFDFLLPLNAPFLLDPALGNPLVQIDVLGNSLGNQPQPIGLDAVAVTTGSSLGALVQFAGFPFAIAVPQRPVLAFVTDTPRLAVPRLQWAGAPRLGTTMKLAMSHAREGTLAAFVLGSGSQWLGAALPLDLASFGAPGCALVAAPEAVVIAATDAAGQAVVDFAVPASGALIGAGASGQFLVFDATANALGLAFSDGVELLFGN